MVNDDLDYDYNDVEGLLIEYQIVIKQIEMSITHTYKKTDERTSVRAHTNFLQILHSFHLTHCTVT